MELNLLSEEHLPDDAIHGGINVLMDNYTKHNLANIYTEMEHIRHEIRSSHAIDIQTTETKIMKLFDKLEVFTHSIAAQHNSLCESAGKEIE
jgi:hypothetical protein